MFNAKLTKKIENKLDTNKEYSFDELIDAGLTESELYEAMKNGDMFEVRRGIYKRLT